MKLIPLLKSKVLKSTLLLCLFLSFSLPASAETVTAADTLVLGMGCFWGAEKRMSEIPGVIKTEVGYAGGSNTSPTYESVSKEGHSNKPATHAEALKVTYDSQVTTLDKVLAAFWQNHDPTQGNRQGNDIGSSYRSAIFYNSASQQKAALQTRDIYQQALSKAGLGKITTEIAPLKAFYPAESYHQQYLKKNPNGYCGLGGTGVAFPGNTVAAPVATAALDGKKLATQQLVVFESEVCNFCKAFEKDIMSQWKSDVSIAKTYATQAPAGWAMKEALWATPTIVLFENGKEAARYTGYDGNKQRFWRWLGVQTLSPEQRKIAFEKGTEMPFTGSNLDNHAAGYYVDPVSGERLFRSDKKFNSGTGWPSFFDPLPGALVLKEDTSHGARRTEVLSASSGIHLGHVFDDGPPPTGKRYCINSAVLKFVPDKKDKTI
jgi:peptide methionine sulfoxide reductase msrA/msrB